MKSIMLLGLNVPPRFLNHTLGLSKKRERVFSPSGSGESNDLRNLENFKVSINFFCAQSYTGRIVLVAALEVWCKKNVSNCHLDSDLSSIILVYRHSLKQDQH